MPAASRRQQRYLAAKFGSAWLREHHFDRLTTSARVKRRRRKGKHA